MKKRVEISVSAYNNHKMKSIGFTPVFTSYDISHLTVSNPSRKIYSGFIPKFNASRISKEHIINFNSIIAVPARREKK